MKRGAFENQQCLVKFSSPICQLCQVDLTNPVAETLNVMAYAATWMRTSIGIFPIAYYFMFCEIHDMI